VLFQKKKKKKAKRKAKILKLDVVDKIERRRKDLRSFDKAGCRRSSDETTR
ncbi:hypothetical protein IscW_ISCW011713, partial [Ixodes scapularis]